MNPAPEAVAEISTSHSRSAMVGVLPLAGAKEAVNAPWARTFPAPCVLPSRMAQWVIVPQAPEA